MFIKKRPGGDFRFSSGPFFVDFLVVADFFFALVVEFGSLFHNILRKTLDVGVAGKIVVLEPVAHKLFVVACGACSNLVC